jgi:hypothetical protein
MQRRYSDPGERFNQVCKFLAQTFLVCAFGLVVLRLGGCL